MGIQLAHYMGLAWLQESGQSMHLIEDGGLIVKYGGSIREDSNRTSKMKGISVFLSSTRQADWLFWFD